jgi:hypothetical protein
MIIAARDLGHVTETSVVRAIMQRIRPVRLHTLHHITLNTIAAALAGRRVAPMRSPTWDFQW